MFEYLIFLAKAITIIVALAAVGVAVAAAGFRRQTADGGHLEVRHLNDVLRTMKRDLGHALLGDGDFKKRIKQEDRALAKARKSGGARKRVFVLTFDGDLQASSVATLRNEITAVLTTAAGGDEVVVRIDSGGGMVHGYGLAASQLQRVGQAGIRLVAAVDKVAASGGYLMASAAKHIIAAPFAVIGSIGVMAQVPNVHRLLKKHDVDV
ncbi:MAG: protease SohB, partial [Gammaproteobacteria bacterium]|nr:protease SohB [Gammaproteobacteria bacterium]